MRKGKAKAAAGPGHTKELVAIRRTGASTIRGTSEWSWMQWYPIGGSKKRPQRRGTRTQSALFAQGRTFKH